jgi:DNA invertase Pin-like site-specific DNA recombinase
VQSALHFSSLRVATYACVSTKDKGQNTKATLAKKKAAEVQLGTPSKSAEVIAQVRQLSASGAFNQAIVRALQLSPSTVAKCVLQAPRALVTRLGQKLRAVR